MDLLRSLTKKQLVDIIKKHPNYQQKIPNWDKKQLIQRIIELDIPCKLNIMNLTEYSQKTLTVLASAHLDFKIKKHGKSKNCLIKFLQEKENALTNNVEIKEKLLKCLLQENEIRFDEAELVEKINEII